MLGGVMIYLVYEGGSYFRNGGWVGLCVLVDLLLCIGVIMFDVVCYLVFCIGELFFMVG